MKIGVTLPQGGTNEDDVARYADIRDAALRAEAAGFDSVWVMDHLLMAFPEQPRVGVWEGLTILSALAEATERVELGTLVLCTAFRNPALLAKMATAIDEISGGRLILGIGAGWHEPEFTAFGYPFDHLASRFEEAVAILAPLLRSGAVDFAGKFERANDCVNIPRGPRPEGPPILMGVSGPRLLNLAARTADAWNAAWLGRADELPERLAPMHAACAAVGRDPGDLALTVGQLVYVPEQDGEEPPGELGERHSFRDADDLASEWRGFAGAGVRHVIVWAMSDTEKMQTLLRTALQRYREESPA